MSVVMVTVKPNAKVERVERLGDTVFKIAVKEPPVDNRANERVRRLLADALDVPLRAIVLKRGAGSKLKTFSVEE